MHIETDNKQFGPAVQVLDAKAVRFVAGDGKTMFEVSLRNDGRSIEIRGVDNCMVNGTLYSNSLEIRPNSANAVVVRAQEYADG